MTKIFVKLEKLSVILKDIAYFVFCKGTVYILNICLNKSLWDYSHTMHSFQISRFERETPVSRGCLPSSRLISKSPVLRETSPNFIENIENLTKADTKIKMGEGGGGEGVQVIKLHQHVSEFHF